MNTKWIALGFFALVSLVQCRSDGADDDGVLQVACTTAMIGNVVEAVGGDRVAVETIVGEGVDPHLYQPSGKDVKTLMGADVVFYNGLMLEGKMGALLGKLAKKGRPTHAVAERVVARDDYPPEGADLTDDPHVWMDVAGWMHAVDVVEEALSEQDPDGAEEFAERAVAYRAQLTELDAYAKRVIARIPESQRVLVTAHDAFGYLGAAYGIEVRGIQGLSTESEAGLRDIEELVSFITERKIPAVFVETSVSDKNVKVLINGAKAAGHEVKIGGSLFSDAMGPEGDYTGTYIGMIDHNVTTIARSLGGEAPASGFQGKLKQE